MTRAPGALGAPPDAGPQRRGAVERLGPALAAAADPAEPAAGGGAAGRLPGEWGRGAEVFFGLVCLNNWRALAKGMEHRCPFLVSFLVGLSPRWLWIIKYWWSEDWRFEDWSWIL